MDNFYLEFFKSQNNPTGFHAPLHYHSCYELVYYVSGNGDFSIENQTYLYGPGTFSILPPEAPHDENTYKASSLLYIGFRYYDVERLLLPGLYTDTEDRYVYHALKEFETEFTEKKPFYPSMLNALTQKLVINLIRIYFHNSSFVHDKNVEYIQRYIDEHCIEKLSMKELAEMSGYSYDWFRHMFKKQTGYSPAQYIIFQKLEIAGKMLKNTDKTITQIAFETNFSSTSQFIALFRKKNSLSPLEYRKKYKNITHVHYSDL